MYQLEKPFKYIEGVKDLKVECKYCGHKTIIPLYVDTSICSYCNRKIKNTGAEYFKYKLRKMIEKEN